MKIHPNDNTAICRANRHIVLHHNAEHTLTAYGKEGYGYGN